MDGRTTRARLTAPVTVLIALALGGCSAFYIAERYAVGVAPRQVVLACRDVYEVYDRADAETILVTSSLGTETTANVCGTGQTRLERFRTAAERFLIETNRPPACRIRGTNDISPVHVEFSYRCG